MAEAETPTTDDTSHDVISRATLEALRHLAAADEDADVVALVDEALAPAPPTAAAAQRRRVALLQCEDAWRLYAARTGILVEPGPRITDEQLRRLRGIAQLEGDAILVSVCDRALRSVEARRACEVAWRSRRLTPALLACAIAVALLLACAAGCVDTRADQLVPVDDVAEPAPSLPPPPAPRLAITVGGRQLGAVEVARGQWLRVRVVAVGSDGTARSATDEASLASADPAVAAAGPGRIEAGARAARATVTATLAGYDPASLEVAVAARPCLPVIASVSPELVAIAVPCLSRVDTTGWRVVWRGPADVAPPAEATLATLDGDAWGPEAAGPGAAPSGAVGLRDRDGALVDSVGYGALAAGHPFVEGAAPAPAMAAGVAMISRTDYVDTGESAADFVAVGGAP